MQDMKSSTLRSVFYFDTMLTPKIITFVYWILLLVTLVASVGLMFEENIIVGIISFPVMAVAIRLWCEFMIVIFKINENIQKIADRAP